MKKKSVKKNSQKYYGKSHDISLKKHYGQHFLKDQSVVNYIIEQVNLKDSYVFEIGCGDGALTKEILSTDISKLWVFEIDPEWVTHISGTYLDNRMTVFQENILDADFSIFRSEMESTRKKWTLLANLPYQITFPLLYKLKENRDILKEGVIMVQEEVAQKIVKQSGRGYGFHSLYLQHFFEWKLLEKVPPTAFYPPPKVDSRLLYFKPRESIQNSSISNFNFSESKEFWTFIKRCFSQPRRNLKNNLKTFHYDLSKLSESTLNLRAEQISKEEFLQIWDSLVKNY